MFTIHRRAFGGWAWFGVCLSSEQVCRSMDMICRQGIKKGRGFCVPAPVRGFLFLGGHLIRWRDSRVPIAANQVVQITSFVGLAI